ncbi:MAG TPA: hypothetical protein VK814_02200 [Acidobacteriaceae bacterium]|jgi:hypothetical protein|nr:hypothetical protein [Acidobacteriaceae bacterium]
MQTEALARYIQKLKDRRQGHVNTLATLRKQDHSTYHPKDVELLFAGPQVRVDQLDTIISELESILAG